MDAFVFTLSLSMKLPMNVPFDHLDENFDCPKVESEDHPGLFATHRSIDRESWKSQYVWSEFSQENRSTDGHDWPFFVRACRFAGMPSNQPHAGDAAMAYERDIPLLDLRPAEIGLLDVT